MVIQSIILFSCLGLHPVSEVFCTSKWVLRLCYFFCFYICSFRLKVMRIYPFKSNCCISKWFRVHYVEWITFLALWFEIINLLWFQVSVPVGLFSEIYSKKPHLQHSTHGWCWINFPKLFSKSFSIPSKFSWIITFFSFKESNNSNIIPSLSVFHFY